jgi:hypothetical protein
MTEDQIKHMVNRFLGWKLPRDFNPDGGISYTRPNYHPGVDDRELLSGTNLFDAIQADRMVRHLIEGMPNVAQAPTECCKGLAPAFECRCEQERQAQGHPPYHRSDVEKTGLTHGDIAALVRRHGGGFHGPNVEHISMEEQAFYRFIDELILNERRAAIDAASPMSSTDSRGAAPSLDESPLLEVWNGDRKVAVYEKEVMRIWGADMEDEMSSEQRDHQDRKSVV